MVFSGYMDFLHGGSGYLEKFFLKRGSRSCQSLILETGTLSLLLYPIGQATIEPRFKEQRHRFYLSVGGVVKKIADIFNL